jgi:hypothetical protein
MRVRAPGSNILEPFDDRSDEASLLGVIVAHRKLLVRDSTIELAVAAHAAERGPSSVYRQGIRITVRGVVP